MSGTLLIKEYPETILERSPADKDGALRFPGATEVPISKRLISMEMDVGSGVLDFGGGTKLQGRAQDLQAAFNFIYTLDSRRGNDLRQPV
jgi:hypothetical protein